MPPIHGNFGLSKWPKLTRCSKYPIHFVLSVLGSCNKRRNNPRHVIDTSDSESDLEIVVNSD